MHLCREERRRGHGSAAEAETTRRRRCGRQRRRRCGRQSSIRRDATAATERSPAHTFSMIFRCEGCAKHAAATARFVLPDAASSAGKLPAVDAARRRRVSSWPRASQAGRQRESTGASVGGRQCQRKRGIFVGRAFTSLHLPQQKPTTPTLHAGGVVAMRASRSAVTLDWVHCLAHAAKASVPGPLSGVQASPWKRSGM